jgi:hypothetical protein
MKLLLFFALLILALAPGCKRKEAVWSSNWQAPLLKDTLDFDKLITEDSLVVVNGQYLELSFNKTIYELKLSDFVKIPDTTISQVTAASVVQFTVPAGSSFVNNAKEHVIDMGDIQLKKIRVKSGGISIKLLNPIQTQAQFEVELPGVTLNGVMLSESFTAPAGTQSDPGVVTGFVDLSNYEMDLRGATLGSFNRIQSRLTVTSDPAGPSVSVGPQDSLRFIFTMNDIVLDYARGYFGNELVSDTVTETIEALNVISGGTIDLPESHLELEVVNGMKVAARAKVTHVKNIDSDNSSVSLTHPTIGNWITVNSATGNQYALQPSSASLVFDGQNSNVEQFLENHGAVNEVGFQVQLNPWGNTSGGWDEIFPQSSVKVNLSGNMPLAIGLSDVVLQDTFDFSFRQDFTKTHVESGMLWLDATNAYPFSGEVTLYLMDASGNTLMAIPGSASVSSSVYGTLVGGVQQQKSHIVFAIPESAVDLLESVSQLSVRLRLNTPEMNSGLSTMVQVPANGFFGFKIGAQLKIENRL